MLEDVFVFPMSFAQERLWFLAQLEPESASYNMATAVRLTGSLDVSVVERCLAEIVRRHEILRTTFAVVDGQPSQVVQPDGAARLERLDLGVLPPAQRDAELRRLIEREARRPFDLTSGPLLRLTLLRLGSEEHILLWGVHHIVFDGWSTSLVLGEFAALYTAFVAGRPAPLADPALQYADFAHWQRQRVEGGLLETQLAYWTKQLSGQPGVLELPTDRPRPATQRYRGARRFFRVPGALAAELGALARREETTLFAVLTAAFQTLLARHAGTFDISVGTPVTNRSRAELEGLVGCFANTVVLRADLSGDPSFAQLLGRVTQAVRAAQTHQEVPFDQVVEAVSPVRDLSHAPLCQVMFALQPVLRQPMEIPGLGVRLLDLDVGGAQFDLSLDVAPDEDGLAAALEYDTDLFDEATIARMADHLLRLLAGAAASPGARLSELPMLAAEEQRQVLGWRTTGALRATPRAVHRMFEEHAARAPGATAVVHEERQITYGELDRRANQLAQLLRRRGVGPEVRVGLCLPRSIEMIAAVLSVLKAGGAYVPLDPNLPRERVAAMIDGAGIRVVIAEEGAAGEQPPGVAVIQLDASFTCARREPSAPPAGEPAPEQAAYTLYTSGSTGTPKGVVVPHRAIASFVDVAAGVYEISSRDRVLQFASLSFDASAEEIFPCLARGATLVLRTEAMLESVAGFLAACGAWGVTAAVLPTMYWHRIVAELGEGAALPPCLRQIVITGEAALPERVSAWRASPDAARVRLLNAYGPTETTVTATVSNLSAAVDPREAWAVPIGRPLANTRAYVLDPAGKPVPAGVVGELYLGGQGLARGYWARPELTAERFVPDPFADRPGERLYRTGDRARWRADGQLEFAGRVDHQVKLRGFRIEPGEIEARLGEQPGVREAVVIVRQDRPEERRLVAYVAASADVAPEELRCALKEQVPDYMVPSAFVVLEELPHTPYGKIDRRALPAPAAPSGEAATPRTEAEATLAGIWAELLGRPAVGIQENFFELGGDSILALQVVSRARAAGLSLTPRQIFQHQTIVDLAAVAAPASAPVAAPELAGDAPLTPIQRWFFELGGPNPHHWNQTVLLELRQRISVEALTAAVRATADHHGALRLRFTREAGGFRQRTAGSAGAAVARVDLSDLPAEAQAAALARAAGEHQAQLHLSEGPLLRAVLFDLGPERPGRLLLVAHHLVVDAVSWRILLEDLQTAYRQLGGGEAIRLPEETLSFGEFARRLGAHARSEAAARQAEAWLAANRPAAALPADDPAGGSLEAETVYLTQFLAAEDTRALLQATPAYRMRVDELLLAAFAGALSRWTGDPAVRIDLEGHGRDALDDVDLSRTVGWFTSIYPVRLEVPAGAAPDGVLKATKEQLRAVPRGGASYGVLRYLSEDERAARLREHAAPQVSFNYLGQWDDLFASSPLFAHAEGDVGRTQDPRTPRGYELEVDAAIVGGRLRVMWNYSGARYRPETMARLSEDFAARLRALVAHCLSPDSGGYTPSDFPLARLDQARLDRLLGAGRDVEDVYPLSPLQQGLLFHSLWEPGSGVYVEQVTCRLEGALDVDAFRRAWEAVVHHHGVLRTTFAWEGADEPLQVVRRGGAVEAVEIEIEDLRGAGDEEHLARVAARVDADRAKGFDLARGPLMRVSLLRLGDEAYHVLWSHHHLLLDGWAASLVLQDAFVAHDALRSGRAVALSARRRYREHIAWLRERDPSAEEPFWRGALSGFSAATPLPLDRVTREASTDEAHGYGAKIVALSGSATARLVRFAQQHRVTTSTLVQAAWALLLSRAARSDDVLFGITVAGRSAPLAGIEAMVGLFINTLPLRVAVPQAASVASWLRDLQKTITELGAHEHTPLAQTRTYSAIPAGQPLFESLLVFENYPTDPRTHEGLPGLGVRDVSFADQTNYPLTLAVLPGGQLQLRLSYDRRRFDEEAASRLLGLVEGALRQLTRRPEAPVGELSLPGELESRRVVTEWNATERAYPDGRRVHELFEAQAERAPDAVAVIFEEQRLSYRELNERANQVARALRRRGVGPDGLVAIAAERSIEMVVGLLGILKAGGAYVPIDPEYPADRIAFMLEDAGAPVLLSQRPVASRLPAHRAEVLCLDEGRAEIDREPTGNLATQVSPDNLAYTIYTSGSTGRPKGAGNSHRGLLNRLQWMQERYGLTAEDRVLQKTPFSFDVSVWEFFWPLMTGAGLVVARPGDHRDGERLVELITRHGVTTLHFVPPMLQAFLEAPGAASCLSLRRVICSGEALPSELARRFFERLGAELHNLYGPTEASIDVTSWACRRDDASASVPIGHPIANTQIYLLDRHGHPAPVGVAGELHIGGVGLARGYHERPALTAERFVPDPFGSTPGGRLYRTGDLARHRPDGAIEFLGRLDHQVKIRGLRVELGEIEARLLQHPEVQEAVVVARDEAHGGKRLVAYVAGRDGSAPEPEALRGWVGEALPAYMVPAPIVVLERLPLSPNGKVDRRALPAPEAAALGHRPYVAPRTEAERILAEVWAEVLHRAQVGVEDNFFELGGDSIVTLQVIARAAQRGLRLSPKLLFEHPTVAEAAAQLTVTAAPEEAPPAPPPAPESPDAGLSAEEWSDLLDELQR
ncbi:amino acid adenylation domain-containing protein [Sorangium sp. So ce1014]|uniref:amino acid adenylation domain-containing protein n=1 Tax=Sorangium sp. So ce1014 TaxID=3133326 RepID=UPI003F63B9EE